MEITFSAANAVGLNNPGTEIITLVKDGGGNFINPPSYDKMRAYLSSGEVPMLFVTTEGGETGSLYQLDEYSEAGNKIRFSNSANAIEFCAGCETPVVSEVGAGGGSISLPLLYDLTTTEEVSWIDTGDNAFTVNSFLIVELVSIATASNEADGVGSASMHPMKSPLKTPWVNTVIERELPALLPKTYNKVFRAFCFRGEDGHWSSITAIRNEVNNTYSTPRVITIRGDGESDPPMRGLIIGTAQSSTPYVLGVGSRLRVWGI